MSGRSSRFVSVCAWALAATLDGACSNTSPPDGRDSDAAADAAEMDAAREMGLDGDGASAVDASADTSPASDGGSGGEPGRPDTGGAGGADAAVETGTETGSETGGETAVASEICGFVMPNPVTSGLPNAASYDTTVPGIVTDNLTGLSWQRQLTAQTASEGCTVNVTGLLYCPLRYAAATCAASRLGGFADWRLPTLLELVSLVDFMQWYPSIDGAAFPDTPYESFWSSTRFAGGRRDIAWNVSFRLGTTETTFIDDSLHVRCVRRASAAPLRCAPPGQRYQVAGNLATDRLTGLTWQRGVSSGSCAGLGPEFRIPSIKELYTLVDYTVSPSFGTPLDLTAFERPQSSFWSSTVAIGEYMGIWVLDLQTGDGSPALASGGSGFGTVKCVR